MKILSRLFGERTVDDFISKAKEDNKEVNIIITSRVHKDKRPLQYYKTATIWPTSIQICYLTKEFRHPYECTHLTLCTDDLSFELPEKYDGIYTVRHCDGTSRPWDLAVGDAVRVADKLKAKYNLQVKVDYHPLEITKQDLENLMKL